MEQHIDITPTAPAPAAAPAAARGGDYHSHLFDCFEDCGICLSACFCAPIQLGLTDEAFDGSDCCATATVACIFDVTCLGLGSVARTPRPPRASPRGERPQCVGTARRRKIREGYGMRGDDSGLDACRFCFCRGCAVAQDAREVLRRGPLRSHPRLRRAGAAPAPVAAAAAPAPDAYHYSLDPAAYGLPRQPLPLQPYPLAAPAPQLIPAAPYGALPPYAPPPLAGTPFGAAYDAAYPATYDAAYGAAQGYGAAYGAAQGYGYELGADGAPHELPLGAGGRSQQQFAEALGLNRM